MNPSHLGLPTRQHTPTINPALLLKATGDSAQPQHPPTLSLAGMSKTTLDALDHANQSHEHLAMRAIHLIGDRTLSLLSAHGTDAHYATADGDLTVHTQLNEQSRYDVISIASPHAGPLYLSLPPPPVNTHEQASSMSSPLAAQHSRGQLTQAMISQSIPLPSGGSVSTQSAPLPSGDSVSTQGAPLPSGDSVSTQGAPLPSGDSVSTQGMVVSNNGSAARGSEAPGPSRNRPARAARSTPYQPPSQPSQSQTKSQGRAAPKPGATEDQIRNHLYDDSGALRTAKAVRSALHAAGLGAKETRIGDLLQAVQGVKQRPSATDAQIREHLYDDEGSLRTQKEVIEALHAIGVGASRKSVGTRLHAVGGIQQLPGATDAQIREHLNNDDGTLRMNSEVRSALQTVGLGVDTNRLVKLMRDARDQLQTG